MPSYYRKGMMGLPWIIWAWSLYDLANTVFSALFVSVNFPVWIKQYAGGDTAIVGATTSVACFLSALVVPILGSITDQTRRRMPILICLTAVCCFCTPLGPYLRLAGAVLVGGLAFFCYYTGLALYDSVLPTIATERIQGRASGLGVGLGYGGTIVALLSAKPIQDHFGSDPSTALKITNWMIGSLYLFFALPLFLMLKEKGLAGPVDLPRACRLSFGRVIAGARQASPSLRTFIGASFCFANAAMAVIIFFGLFALDELKLELPEFYKIYAGLAISALLGSFIAGRVVDKVGPRRVLIFIAVFWIVCLIYMTRVTTERGFIIAGMGGGAALGTLWTATRPMIIRLANPERMGETFGFLGMANSSSAVIGPFVFGLLAKHYGYDVALFALIGFFVVGLGLLSRVKLPPLADTVAAA